METRLDVNTFQYGKYINVNYKRLYINTMEDEYNVNGYTDEQLYQILDLNNPSDRELEAKVLSMVRKYDNFGNESGDKLSQFFIDIYNRFFENNEEDDSESDNAKEGFQTYKVDAVIVGNGNTYNSGVIGTPLPGNVKAENIFSSAELSQKGNGVIGTANMGNMVTPKEDNVKLTKQLDYSKDSLNPLLKQTIKRIISIDSQYRNSQKNSPSTSFTFDLSEPLRDVVSLSLYSIQIPYTWYTVNSDFGGNFFYLKGNTPGINNGLHDYKITIPSGNYTPSGITNAVNAAIQNTAAIYTDASFGTTQAIYNNGVNDTSSGTNKCALQIDITKIYNESNYSLDFPIWSTPLNDTTRLTTIAGYLGFNNQQYYCSSICSYPFFSTLINDDLFPITTTKTSFKIVPYIGASYLTADVSYTPITVNIDLSGITQITISNVVSLLNTTLKNNTNFDSDFTSCTLVDISNVLQYGNGYSYVKFNCKLNKYKSPIVSNLKLAAVFPYDNPEDSLFYTSVSLFAFSDSVTDASNNVICEFNEIVSESPILQSSYDSSNTTLNYICYASGYDNSYNNIPVTIPNGTYTLDSFIITTNNRISTAFTEKVTTSGFNAKASFNSDPVTSYLNFKTQIDNTFLNKDYSIYTTPGNVLHSLFNILDEPNNIAASNSYNNPIYAFTSVTFDASAVIYIKPISNGNRNALSFVVRFVTSTVYSNGAILANYLNTVITNYKDPVTGLYPLVGSNVTYNVSTGFTLKLSIITHINQSFYRLTLSPIQDKNIWSSLSFDSSYNLTDYSNNNYTITSESSIKTNQITIIKNVNDIFYLRPSNLVDVFNSSNNAYLITIKIPDTSINGGGTTYAINDLLNVINTKLQNTIAKGTVFSTYPSTNGQTFLKIRFNINKVFSTKDYTLVFYDPYSFTTCFSNSSRNTTTSIQNATWDSTLGWLLGYRNQISYALSDYVDIIDISGTTNPSIYYLQNLPNACYLIGDTNVSTNLYNYFLIMLDDYVQNHLNDGLVTITNQETSIDPGPYVNICDPVTGKLIARPADYGSPGITYTAQQLYAFNQQVQSQIVKARSYSSGPFVQDIFGIIPVKTSGMSIGSVYVEFGGSLQNQQRLYFGPVNIHRMTIKLLNDRGNLVDLNNANWSFSFICEQLYKNGVS